MKTCKILLMILSLSLWLAGCKEADDGKVGLSGLVVNPTSIEMAANDSKTIGASPVPPNSSDLVFSWTTNKEGVVSLSATDSPTVWVSGVAQGEVTVTVTCNGESVNIPVKVYPILDSILLDKEELNLIGNNDSKNQAELVAIADPADAFEVIFKWTAEPAGIVSLSPSDPSGSKVTVKAENFGSALITAQCGDILSKPISVNVSREVRLDYLVTSVAAQWKFDNPNDLGKAAKGENLQLLVPGSVKAVPGPTASDGAVEGTRSVADLRAHHGLTGESLDNFTIMWDARFPAGEPNTGSSAYYAGYWNGTYGSDASMFMVYRMGSGSTSIYDPETGTNTSAERQYMLDVGVSGYNVLEGPYYYPDSSSWMRVVMTISKVDESTVRMDVWKNGVKVMDNANKSRSQFGFTKDGWIYLLTDAALNEDFTTSGDEDRPHPLANFAIWGYAMTEIEVQLLGSIGTGL
jgi:hypothetical protein